MTQPLRAAHCAAYVSEHAPDGSAVVIVSDPAAFTHLHLPEGTDVRSQRPPTDLLPTHRLLRSKLRQRIVNYSRSGSPLGRKLEQVARTGMWRLRYVDRIVIGERAAKDSRASASVRSGLINELYAIHNETPIGDLVTFDVYDLPTLLKFAAETGVAVRVR